jgi:hypothetical protein
MPIAFTQTQKLPEFRTMRVIGTLTFSGSYVAGGEVPTGLLKPGTIKNPLWANFYNKTAHQFRYDAATGKVLCFVPAGTEVPAAAYPGALTSDVVIAEFEYPKA